ncbi:MAG: FkbM family methyltransferase [Planctomycetaceae bacterium]
MTRAKRAQSLNGRLREVLRGGASRIYRKIRDVASGESYALDDIDRKLRRYLDFDNGFFIEAGANDGIEFSNTLYFEKYRNWSGLLIEPLPQQAALCAENRPRCYVENCALVSSDYTGPTIEMRFCGQLSLVKGAMKCDETERKHIERGCELQKIETYSLTVPARTLTSILESHGILHVDFLSLDVEGYELEALRGLDFDRYHPSFMLIEAHSRDELDRFLRPHYEPIAELSRQDVLYRRAGGRGP